MTARDFVYWLQGYFELLDENKDIKENSELRELTRDQVNCIKRHLKMVFVHDIDPSMGNAEHQKKLNQAHAPAKPIPEPLLHGPLNPAGDFDPGPKFRC